MALGLIFIILGFCLFFILSALIFVFWIWMIIDCAKRNFKKDDDKIIWLLIITLAQIIGAVIYYFVIKQKNKR